jgi:NADH-ubiquinone oxidoreductase chain 2
MFIKKSNFMLWVGLLITILIIISLSNWFLVWVCLEINLIIILPILLYKRVKRVVRSTIKYFITQVLASLIIIFTFVLSLFFVETSLRMYQDILVGAIMLKMGVPPFHL